MVPDVKELTGLNDWIFDVSITANRPTARVFSVWQERLPPHLGEPLKTPALDYTETEVEKRRLQRNGRGTGSCPRYIAHYVYDVKLGQSRHG